MEWVVERKARLCSFLKITLCLPHRALLFPPKLATAVLRGLPILDGEVVLHELNSYHRWSDLCTSHFVSVLGARGGLTGRSGTAETLKMFKMFADRATSRTSCSVFRSDV